MRSRMVLAAAFALLTISGPIAAKAPATLKMAAVTATQIDAAIANPARTEADRALDESRHPEEVLTFAGLRRGDVVVDYYAGGGYFSNLMARLVGPQGRVYALDPPSFMKQAVWDENLKRHKNLLLLTAPADTLMLAPDSADLLLANMAYHDLYFQSEKYKMPYVDPAKVTANWFKAIRPGGHVVIVDHFGPSGDTRDVVNRLHRIDPKVVIADMQGAGFVLESQSDVLQRSEDSLEINVFDPTIRGKTSKFMLKFRRP